MSVAIVGLCIHVTVRFTTTIYLFKRKVSRLGAMLILDVYSCEDCERLKERIASADAAIAHASRSCERGAVPEVSVSIDLLNESVLQAALEDYEAHIKRSHIHEVPSGRSA